MAGLMAITLALVCNTVEPIHEYKRYKDEDAKYGLNRAESYGIFGSVPCWHTDLAQKVEIIERNDSYPWLVKVRYTRPEELVYDDHNKILGKGKTYEGYAVADDFGAKIPDMVEHPKPSAKALELRKRIKEVKDKWGIRGDTVFAEE